MTSMPQVGAFGVNVPYESGYRDMRGDERENATLAYQRTRDEAQDSRQWQMDMSNTSWQRGTADMKAAGINPMLAVSQGGASTPAGAMGQVKKADTPSMPSAGANVQMQTAAQVRNLDAQTEKLQAETKEIAPTAGVGREYTAHRSAEIRQAIGESAMRIEEIIAKTDFHQSSAAHKDQDVKNLKATIPQIQETVRLIKTQSSHLGQQVRENLPKLEAALRKLEVIYKSMEMPGRETAHAFHQSATGAVLQTIREALKDILPGVGVILPGRTPPQKGSTSTSTTTHRPNESTTYKRTDIDR